jgi:hypothetical protein
LISSATVAAARLRRRRVAEDSVGTSAERSIRSRFLALVRASKRA